MSRVIGQACIDKTRIFKLNIIVLKNVPLFSAISPIRCSYDRTIVQFQKFFKNKFISNVHWKRFLPNRVGSRAKFEPCNPRGESCEWLTEPNVREFRVRRPCCMHVYRQGCSFRPGRFQVHFGCSQDNQQDINVLGYAVRANVLMIAAAVIAAVMSVLCVLIVCRSRRSKTCCKRKASKNKVSNGISVLAARGGVDGI